MSVIGAGFGLGVGCSDPPGIVQVAPPGIELQRVPPPTAGSGSEAKGESKEIFQVKYPPSEPTQVGVTKKTSSALSYTTLKEGTGPTVKAGQTIEVHYVGRLEDGTKFDASTDRGSPMKVQIGVGRVIKGWDEGIPGMKVGEKRQLLIPSDLGYGSAGFPPKIPANSNLRFDVEVLNAE